MEDKIIVFKDTDKAEIVGNKLLVIHDVEVGCNYTKKMFPGDDRDRIPIYKREVVEFVLPENHNQRIDFVDYFAISYKEADGEKFFVSVETIYLEEHQEEHEAMREALENGLNWSPEVIKEMNDLIDADIEFDKMMTLPMNNKIKNDILGEWENEDFNYSFLENNTVNVTWKKNCNKHAGVFHINENMMQIKIDDFPLPDKYKINYIREEELSIQDFYEQEDSKELDLQILTKVELVKKLSYSVD